MTHAKRIEYDRETKDFALYLNGELVGFAATHLDGERQLNALVYNILSRTPAVVIEEPTPAAEEPTPAAEEPVAAPELLPQIAAVVARVRASLAAEHERWRNAVNTAYNELAMPGWSFEHGILTIPSRTSKLIYHIGQGPDGRVQCQCTAYAKGQPCWHRAAWRLCVLSVRPQRRDVAA